MKFETIYGKLNKSNVKVKKLLWGKDNDTFYMYKVENKKDNINRYYAIPSNLIFGIYHYSILKYYEISLQMFNFLINNSINRDIE